MVSSQDPSSVTYLRSTALQAIFSSCSHEGETYGDALNYFIISLRFHFLDPLPLCCFSACVTHTSSLLFLIVKELLKLCPLLSFSTQLITLFFLNIYCLQHVQSCFLPVLSHWNLTTTLWGKDNYLYFIESLQEFSQTQHYRHYGSDNSWL